MIGVRCTGEAFEIWGIVQSGPRWLQSARGGRDLPSPVPFDAVVVRADGPGHLAIAIGDVTLAELRAGHLAGVVTNVFESQWLGDRFALARSALLQEHAAELGEPEVPFDTTTIRSVSQQMVKRIIATIRDSQHGGGVVFIPQERAAAVVGPEASIHLKYSFAEEEPRQRYRKLIRGVMRELLAEALESEPRPARVDWLSYQASTRNEIVRLDEAIMEMSHLIAGLAAVDGVVVLSERPARIVAEVRVDRPYPRHRDDPHLVGLRHELFRNLGLAATW
jgi:hypothetical protein